MRKVVLSIAGFDGCAGAGILSDIKTFQACSVPGMGVLSAITAQNEIELRCVSWIALEEIYQQLNALTDLYQIKVVKVGIIENLMVLKDILTALARLTPRAKVIWDPIVQSSSGFRFQSNFTQLKEILALVDIITPNIPEAEQLTSKPALEAASVLSESCAVVLKGGHANNSQQSDDLLFVRGEVNTIQGGRLASSKHGSGCVFSASLAAAVFNDCDLVSACRYAKEFTTKFLLSSETLLGEHQ